MNEIGTLVREVNWYAVQTRPHLESLAAASVAQLDVEVFLPRIQQDQYVGGVSRRVARPLFPGYFFARFCPLLSLDAIRYARGLIRVVGGHHLPIPLGNEAIAEIRSRIQPDGFIGLHVHSFEPGDRVVIEQGPFEGFMGQVEQETNDGRRVAILLEAINRARILIEKRWLSVVADRT